MWIRETAKAYFRNNRYMMDPNLFDILFCVIHKYFLSRMNLNPFRKYQFCNIIENIVCVPGYVFMIYPQKRRRKTFAET